MSVAGILRRAGIDDAVRFALLTRIGQGVGGAVTLILIARHFSAVEQGFYYTLMSLLALQAFVELGLQIVIVNRASHEWSRLDKDRHGAVIGEAAARSRLASLARFTFGWYAALAAVFLLGVGLAGQLFLAVSPESGVAWRGPWWTSISLAAVQLWLLAPLALLEGCNQVVAVNRLRFVQVVTEALAVWSLIAFDAGLWALVGSLAAKLLVPAVFLVARYRLFFTSLYADKGEQRIDWWHDIWPMQWRLAAQASVNYLMFSLFTPIMFRYHGAEVAGQTGMTLQIVSMVMVLGQAWVQTKVPRFGVLVATRRFRELDQLWWGATKTALCVVGAGAAAVWATVVSLPYVYPSLAARVLTPLPTSLFLIGYGVMQLSYFQALYLRAHAREPYLFLGVSAGLFIGLAVFLVGGQYGPMGAAASFCAVVCLYMLPVATLIWLRRRAEWQAREPGQKGDAEPEFQHKD